MTSMNVQKVNGFDNDQSNISNVCLHNLQVPVGLPVCAPIHQVDSIVHVVMVILATAASIPLHALTPAAVMGSCV